MPRPYSVGFGLILLLLVCVAASPGPFVTPAPLKSLLVDDLPVIEASRWALQHLRGMCESGAYEELRLLRVISAGMQRGVYHDNLHLELELTAPVLLGGSASSLHRIVVMTDREDGVRSFAIDAFPLLEPGTVERAWTRKGNAEAARRERDFKKLEREHRLWRAGAPACGDEMGSDDTSDPRCDELLALSGRGLGQWPTANELEALERGATGFR